MMTRGYAPKYLSFGILFSAWMSLTGAQEPCGSERQFREMFQKAMRATEMARWSEANDLWREAHALAPNAFDPLANLASLAARDGRVDDAFKWLDEAYGGCFNYPEPSVFDPESFRSGEDYIGLHKDRRWELFLRKLADDCELRAAALQRRQPEPDPTSAPSFTSFRKLSAAFDRRRDELVKGGWCLSYKEYLSRAASLRAQRINAVHRYLLEHGRAKDRADAAWNAIKTRTWPRFVERLEERWGEFGLQVIEEIDGFVREYPGNAHASEAQLERAFVAFHVRGKASGPDLEWNNEDIDTLCDALSKVNKNYAGTTAAGIALVWQLRLALQSRHEGKPEIRRTLDELRKTYRDDKRVQNELVEWAAGADIAIFGMRDFDGKDLAGNHWTGASFEGKVTLLSFWATWCNPCVTELAAIRKAWDEYHSRGLVVLGVSLDYGNSATFREWLEQNHVTWPQIWEGNGFSSQLATRYHVRTIPLNVLIDRDGHVTSMYSSAQSLLDRIRTLCDRQPDETTRADALRARGVTSSP